MKAIPQRLKRKLEECAYFGHFCENYLRIKDQDGNLSPLKLKPVQKKIAGFLVEHWIHRKPIRLIILKARREGVSTVVAAFYHWICALNNNINCYMLSHNAEGVSYIYDMHSIFYDEMDADIRPMRRHFNAKIMRFENPDDKGRQTSPGRRSEIRVASAKTGQVGSGYMTTLMHASEIAKWEKAKECMISIKQSVPKPPRFSCVILESTAFGAGNYFHQEWKRAIAGDSEYAPMFFAWYAEKEYSDKVPNGFACTEYEKSLKKKYELSDEQIMWRRRAIRDECDGDERIFQQEYPSNPDEAFLVTGRGVFDASVLAWHELRSPKETKWRGRLTINVLEQRGKIAEKLYADKVPRGEFQIYEAPQEGRHYCIGADVAEGIDKGAGKYSKGDRSAAHVICQETGKLVAKWVGWASPDHFGKMLCYIGKEFNKAFIGVEANNHGILTLATLRDIGYPLEQIYHREILDEDYDDDTAKMGWMTSKRTKPLLIGELVAGLRDKELYGVDEDTISELRTYTRDEKGKMGGESGCYDDQVISLALAWKMVTTMRDDLVVKKPAPKKLRAFNEGSFVIEKHAALTA